jgi:hypothetical protein
MPTTVVDGGCICGAIRYRVRGEPTGSMVCHCQTCRRVAGAPVVAWVTFPSAQFEFLQGQPSEFHSSAPVRRTFCAACGTPLTYEHADGPGFVDITTCTLDDPNLFRPTHRRQHLVLPELVPSVRRFSKRDVSVVQCRHAAICAKARTVVG